MIRRIKQSVLIIGIALATPSYLIAEEDLSAISLEDLLNIEVSSATKTEGVSIQKAPSVVRVFTRDMIEKQGYKTIKDLLNQVPGIQVQEYRAGHQLAWIRGVQSRYNSKILWLIDGVPMRDSYYGHSAIDQMFPLDYIDHVEVINGPGSVLYGANAFAGVVSITTKNKGKSVSVSGGSFSTQKAGAEYGWENGYGYLNYFKNDGFEPDLNINGEPINHPQDTERKSGYLTFGGEKLSATVSFTDYDYTDIFRKSGRFRTHHRNPLYVSGRYQDSYSNGGNLSVMAYYEQYDYHKLEKRITDDGTVTAIDDEILDTSLMGIDLDYSFMYGEHSIIAGASYQTDKEEGITAIDIFPDFEQSENLKVPGISRNTFGVFSQAMWKINEEITFTTGIRYDAQSDFDNELNYRLGLTYVGDIYYAKALLGTAYRVPTYREYIDIKSFNDNLAPEQMTTFELQWGMKQGRSDVNITLFRNQYEDFIKELNVFEIVDTPVNREIDDEYAINAKEVIVSGIEVMWRYFPTDKLQLSTGFSHILDATQEIGVIDSDIILDEPDLFNPDKEDVLNLAENTINLAAAYQVSDTFNFGLDLLYVDERAVSAIYQNDVDTSVQDLSNNDGFLLLGLNSLWQVTESLELELKINNLTDEQIYSPPADKPDGYDPEWPGQSFDLQIKYSY